METPTVNDIHEKFTLYFAADAASQQAGNTKLNDKVSLAIASEQQDFHELAACRCQAGRHDPR